MKTVKLLSLITVVSVIGYFLGEYQYSYTRGTWLEWTTFGASKEWWPWWVAVTTYPALMLRF